MKLNVESPLFQFINTACSFIALNIVFIITCIPVITIGSAVTALYQVTLKEARNEGGYLIRPYLHAMKENFKISTPAFLFYLLAGSVLFFNMSFWSAYGGAVGAVFLLAAAAGFLMLVISALYTFPLLARFDNTWLQTLKNAYPVAMSHRRTTLLLLLFHVLAAALFYYASPARIFMGIIGFSFLSYCSSYVLVRVFQEYEPEASRSEEAAC